MYVQPFQFKVLSLFLYVLTEQSKGHLQVQLDSIQFNLFIYMQT
jgi:hypothetical protein